MKLIVRGTLNALLLVLFFTQRQVHAFSAPSVSSTTSSTSATSLTEDELVALAKDYLENQNGFYAPIDRSAHADDFVFRAGVVGPLNKQDYCTTMDKLGIAQAFDMSPNAFGFCVDPEEENTVRFFVRYTGKHVKPWIISGTPINIPVTNTKPIQGPTEAFCLKFNEKRQVKFFTISNPINYGNPREPTTGKLGAVLGLFNHVGAPYLAESALNENVRKASLFVSDLLPEDAAPPKTASRPESLPQWWKGI